MLLVPGLLQTPEYARAVMKVSGFTEDVVEARTATRMGRQVVLSRPSPPRLTAIIDEAALRRPLGSPTVMAEQARHLIKSGQRENVTIRVIPFIRGGHPAVNGTFSVLEFAKAATIVHLEHLRSSLFVDDRHNVEAFLRTVATLDETALNPAESADFLADLARFHEEQ